MAAKKENEIRKDGLLGKYGDVPSQDLVTAISAPTGNGECWASARGKGRKGKNNQIYSYLFIC